MLRIEAPHFVAGIDFKTKEAAPILRWALRLTEEEFLQSYVTKRGYKVMALIQGQVESVKESPGKFGSMFGIIVNGTRYGIGKTSGGVNAGDWVEFTAEQNPRGYWDADKGTLKPMKAPSTASSLPVAQAVKFAQNAADVRQDSIIYQSSRKDALEFVKILQVAGCIDTGKAKGADKIAIFETFLDRFTEHFIDEVKTGKPHDSQTDSDAPADLKEPNASEVF